MKPDREFSARFLRFHMTAISRKIGIFVSVMEKIRFVALIFCLSFLYAICDAQELTPVVSQFDKEDYMAANQNWAVSQDADGIMYFGNGEGLLAFDGILWTLYNLPHNKIARSVMADGDRIYVGSYEEFGFFRKRDKTCEAAERFREDKSRSRREQGGDIRDNERHAVILQTGYVLRF